MRVGVGWRGFRLQLYALGVARVQGLRNKTCRDAKTRVLDRISLPFVATFPTTLMARWNKVNHTLDSNRTNQQLFVNEANIQLNNIHNPKQRTYL